MLKNFKGPLKIKIKFLKHYIWKNMSQARAFD
jgi:hypothetical protein